MSNDTSPLPFSTTRRTPGPPPPTARRPPPPPSPAPPALWRGPPTPDLRQPPVPVPEPQRGSLFHDPNATTESLGASVPGAAGERRTQPTGSRPTGKPSGVAARAAMGGDRAGLPPRLDPRAGVGRARHRRFERPGIGRLLGLSVLGALIPGVAYLIAGRRALGIAVVSVFLVVVGAGVRLVFGDESRLLRLLVDPNALLVITIAVPLLAAGWIAVILTGHHGLRPRGLRQGQRVVSTVLMMLLCLGIALPAAVAANAAFLARDALNEIFADDGQSATIPTPADAGNPFGDQERVNVLLLGGDGAPDREGVRTDSVIVASIDTASGATTLFSLPRNLEDLPFPEGPLRDAYPDGFEGYSESDGLLNAVYRTIPDVYPDILGPTDNLGADALKLGLGEALGLTIDYYLLINLDGFRTLVDILGGITVNINEWVPIGGDDSAGIRPDDYLTPGPDQLLTGEDALWYARGRYALSDYSRMARQRCAMDAIIAAADPFTLLSRYQEIAETAPELVLTDIPRSVLPAFVDLGVLIKDASVRSLVFDDTVITPAFPDYDLIRSYVETALADPVANGEPEPSPTSTTPSTTAPPSSSTDPTDDPTVVPGAEDITSLCAYDALAAEEAIAAGEPPTRRG